MTCGFALLLNPFGASSSPTFLTLLVMTGSLGKPRRQPGNGTSAAGAAPTAAPTGSNGVAAVTIIVGSGADDAMP